MKQEGGKGNQSRDPALKPGKPLWFGVLPGDARDKLVFGLPGNPVSGLVCFELATGKIVWTDKHQMTPRGRNPQANLVWLGDTDRAIALNANGHGAGPNRTKWIACWIY